MLFIYIYIIFILSMYINASEELESFLYTLFYFSKELEIDG